MKVPGKIELQMKKNVVFEIRVHIHERKTNRIIEIVRQQSVRELGGKTTKLEYSLICSIFRELKPVRLAQLRMCDAIVIAISYRTHRYN